AHERPSGRGRRKAPGEGLPAVSRGKRLHGPQERSPSPATEADKRARSIDGKCGDVAAICGPRLLRRLNGLFDIGHVKGRDVGGVFLKVARDGSKGFRSGKVSDNWNDQVLLLHLPDKTIIGFGGQEVSVAPL